MAGPDPEDTGGLETTQRGRGRLRILFLSWRDLANAQAGGSEVLVDNLIRGVERQGHSAALVCGGPTGRRPYPVLSAGGTYSHYLRAPFVARRFRHWDALVEVVNGFPYFTPLWWRRPRVCVFNHVHGAQWQMHFPKPVAAAGWFVESEVIPRLYRRTEFATISPSTATDLSELGVARTRIHPLQLGLDDRLFSEPGRKSREPLFVVVSRLTPNKRVGTVLDAWEQVRPRTGGRLVVIGDGPEMEALKARGVPGVDFVGFVTEEEKLALVDRAWLLLHGAANEGWGLVVMEAAARRTPSLAFDVNGVRDAVVDGVTGVLVDSPQALADRWAALVVDRPGLELMGDAARARALEFTWDRTTTELLDVIRGSKGRQR